MRKLIEQDAICKESDRVYQFTDICYKCNNSISLKTYFQNSTHNEVRIKAVNRCVFDVNIDLAYF